MIPVTTAHREAAAANTRAWETVLDRLERDVAVTEQLVRSPEGVTVLPAPAPWDPPALNGPLPDHLLGRAREIHRRQTEARAGLADALATNRARSLRISPRPAAGTGPVAAYVDVSA